MVNNNADGTDPFAENEEISQKNQTLQGMWQELRRLYVLKQSSWHMKQAPKSHIISVSTLNSFNQVNIRLKRDGHKLCKPTVSLFSHVRTFSIQVRVYPNVRQPGVRQDGLLYSEEHKKTKLFTNWHSNTIVTYWKMWRKFEYLRTLM